MLDKGDDFIHESIIGSKFIGRIEEELKLDGQSAIRPSIEGWAKIYGYNSISIDKDDDPYAYGFQVIWTMIYGIIWIAIEVKLFKVADV